MLATIAYPDLTAKPPFCPNAVCGHHLLPRSDRWWRPAGVYTTRAFGTVSRFKCRLCGTTFSSQTFRLDYYAKKRIDYRYLQRAHAESVSIRGLGRLLSASCGTVMNRLDRLGRQMISLHGRLRLARSIHEDICIDGLQSFDASQYYPNNYTIATTRSSLFALGFTHATLRRSGRMTAAQKEHRNRLEALHRFESSPIDRSFTELLDQLARETRFRDALPLVLVTDEHRAYASAFKRHALFRRQDQSRRCVHYTVSSTEARTGRNPLFASNYMEREIRKDQAAHRRESVCYNRSVANGVLRMWAYIGWHNYGKRHAISAPYGDERTHAQMSGIPKRLIEYCMGAAFEYRAFLSRCKPYQWERKAWLKALPTPLKTGSDYLPAYAAA